MRPLLVLALLVAGAAQAAERPVRSRLCLQDLPEGVRLPPPPGCGAPEAGARQRDDGFRDLGNGISVRIGGRAAAEFGARR